MLSDTLTALTSAVSLASRVAFGSEYTATDTGEFEVYLFLSGLKSPAVGVLGVQYSVDMTVKRTVNSVTTTYAVGNKPQWNKRDIASTAEMNDCGEVYLKAGDKFQLYVTSSNSLDTTTLGAVLLHPKQAVALNSDSTTAIVNALATSQASTFAQIISLLTGETTSLAAITTNLATVSTNITAENTTLNTITTNLTTVSTNVTAENTTLNTLVTNLAAVASVVSGENTTLGTLLTNIGQVLTTLNAEGTSLQQILTTLTQILYREQGLPPTGPVVGAGE